MSTSAEHDARVGPRVCTYFFTSCHDSGHNSAYIDLRAPSKRAVSAVNAVQRSRRPTLTAARNDANEAESKRRTGPDSPSFESRTAEQPTPTASSTHAPPLALLRVDFRQVASGFAWAVKAATFFDHFESCTRASRIRSAEAVSLSAATLNRLNATV